MRILLIVYLTCFIKSNNFAYTPVDPDTLDNNDLEERLPIKILHAEPLYIDLIRDLGAHKGEKEWNIGTGMTDRLYYDSYEFLVEYEWAPINRLGLEVEVPVTMYMSGNAQEVEKPASRIESIKMAAQYTFLVSENWQTSLAIGGITELEFYDLRAMRTNQVFQGFLFNPFFIGAKRWEDRFYTLIYTGPRITQYFNSSANHFAYEINTNFHYMIPGTRNFVGVEFNKLVEHGEFDMVIRPQMRLVINDNLMVGIVPGIPVSKEKERLSSFLRLIYEPGHHKAHKQMK